MKRLNRKKRNYLLRQIPRVFWWEIRASEREPARIIAQIIEKGSKTDIERLLYKVGRKTCVRVVDANLKAGWFQDHWEFYQTVICRRSVVRPKPQRYKGAPILW